jgi:hypothetical protein
LAPHRQVVPVNLAGSARGTRHVVTSGQTPVLDPDEARALLDSINLSMYVVEYRRATAETFAPAAKDSATIRPLSSCDHARRPPTPVITSSRRTPTTHFDSNVGIRMRVRPKRKKLPDHLPRQELVHEPEHDGACTCPACGGDMAWLR